jgi:hypothetical protein
MRGRLVGSGTTKGAHGGFGQSACASRVRVSGDYLGHYDQLAM